MPNILLEACVETLEQALLAEKNGAHRLELCSCLEVGGLSPPMEVLQAVLAHVHLPVLAMVRPRAGDFCYSPAELDAMKRSIEACKKAGCAGVVFGVLTQDKEIDRERTAELVRHSFPLEVTFHKAIDDTPDAVQGTEILAQIPGIHRILSSGQAATALEGAAVLKQMLAAADERLSVVVAGKVTHANLAEVHRTIGGSEYHGRKIVF